MTPEEYAERRAKRAARYRQYAANAAARAAEAQADRECIAGMIPMGQPVLVGHHSEGRHRRDLARMDRTMRRQVEESDRAAHWEQRATGVENDRSIRSADPEATAKLRARIAEIESQIERRKTINAKLRQGATLADLDLTPEEARDLEMVKRYQPHLGAKYAAGTCYPPYALTNLNGNLRRLRERLTSLES